MTALPKHLPLARAKRLEPRPGDTVPPSEPPPTDREPAPAKARAPINRQAKVLPKLSREVLALGRSVYPVDPAQRLPKRSECLGGPRPCPLVSCSNHLKYDVNPDNGSIWDNHPGVEVEDMKESCALDLADRGPMSHEEIGAALGTSKQRAFQIEEKAKAKLTARADRIRDLFDGCIDFEIRIGGDE